MPPAMAGDEYSYQWFRLKECSTAPGFASATITRLVSAVSK